MLNEHWFGTTRLLTSWVFAPTKPRRSGIGRQVPVEVAEGHHVRIFLVTTARRVMSVDSPEELLEAVAHFALEFIVRLTWLSLMLLLERVSVAGASTTHR